MVNTTGQKMDSSNNDPTSPKKQIALAQNVLSNRIQKNRSIDQFIDMMDYQYRISSLVGLCIWIILISTAYYLGYKYDSLHYTSGNERFAPILAAVILAMSFLSMFLPLVHHGKKKAFSGVIICAVIIQSIALITDILLATTATPVFIDPFSGRKVYLLRWSEWTPLAFLMTLMTEGADHTMYQEKVGSDTDHSLSKVYTNKLRVAYTHAICQGVSTFCGYLFPFCSSTLSWVVVMVISCVLFCVIYVRIWVRTAAHKKMKNGSSVDENEMMRWAWLSLKLLRTCAFFWSILVVAFFFYTFGPIMFPDNPTFQNESLTMVCESLFDVCSKAMFVIIIVDVHDTVFNPETRAERRLEELRKMMGVVWDNCSDMICISVRSITGRVSTMISPTYLKNDKNGQTFHEDNDFRKWNENSDSPALAFELDGHVFDDCNNVNIDHMDVYDVKFADLSGLDINRRNRKKSTHSVTRGEMSSLANLVVKSWKNTDSNNLLMHDLIRNINSKELSLRCEAKVTKLDSNSIVIVIRDISERLLRFEAEKHFISESTARIKDAEANRFTKHEVKNGLLAAIELCDNMCELLTSSKQISDSITSLRSISTQPYSPLECCLLDLDRTLHEVLDTILAETMAKDVMHEVYQPNIERVNITQLLHSSSSVTSPTKASARFQMKTYPPTLPDFALDRHLIKYIHRNAISNACKYGKPGGKVLTELYWEEKKQMLEMKVINAPGENHEKILELGEEACKLVFKSRTRLPMHSENVSVHTDHSSGDGAWIMWKCAKILGGVCNISFEKDRTVFSFRCRVMSHSSFVNKSSNHTGTFKLPSNIYGIAIDDSMIQRKLLHRFFKTAGIPEDRIKIMGNNPSELKEFDKWLLRFIESNPDNYFLVIVDENLDVDEDEFIKKHVTISGSNCISEVRKKLHPSLEKKMLALVRSANDSMDDTAIYKARAHGYISKRPITNDNVLDLLQPLWYERFPRTQENVYIATVDESPIDDLYDDDDNCLRDDVLRQTDSIQSILDSYSNIELETNWGLVWEKLHRLKGDLMIINSNDSYTSAVQIISEMRGPFLPQDFADDWKKIIDLIK